MGNEKPSISPMEILILISTMLSILKLLEIGPFAFLSWWWVSSPVWFPFVAIFAIGAYATIVDFITKPKEK
jgi:hypothetical protein